MATDDAQPPGEGGAPREVRPYRSPRYPVFLGTGAVLGLVTGVLLALYGGASTASAAVTGTGGVLGYFVAFGVIIGALLGGTLAMGVEALLNRGRRGPARPAPRRRPGGTPPR